jgi:hypothetical protein
MGQISEMQFKALFKRFAGGTGAAIVLPAGGGERKNVTQMRQPHWQRTRNRYQRFAVHALQFLAISCIQVFASLKICKSKILLYSVAASCQQDDNTFTFNFNFNFNFCARWPHPVARCANAHPVPKYREHM